MIKKIKEKLNNTKKKAKWVLALLISVALAAPPIIDNQINPYIQVGELYDLPIAQEMVRIGGENPAEFKPEAHLGKWNNEVWLKVKYPTNKKIKPTKDLFSKKLKWKDKDREIHFYPLEPREITENGHTFKQLEQGGFEFEIILKKKPKTNKIVLPIETKGLKFYYQPPLTQEEIDEGHVRPENVVGSYAVYHETQDKYLKTKEEGDKYRTGKAFHIYRPKIEDANGNWVWGELNIDEETGVLTTTIPQYFLDTAVYPVSTGTSNFGYETIGTAGTYGVNDRLAGSVFTGAAGTGVSITAYIDFYSATPDTMLYTHGLYTHSDDALVTNGTTNEGSSSSDGWKTLTFATGPTLSAVDYVIVTFGDSYVDLDTLISVVYDDGEGTTQGHVQAGLTYPTFPNPASWTHKDYKVSIYCTYTPSAAAQSWGWTTFPE